MSNKYLEDIINIENTPYGWCENTGRDEMWKEQREKYGFDERETWDLDFTFFCWLYSRLKMFKEIDFIDLTFHKFNINGKTMTQEECIDKMIENCEKIIKEKKLNLKKEKDEVFDIWKACSNSMWW